MKPTGISAYLLLEGIVGSTAYGLAGPDSDVDILGLFAVRTFMLHGLHSPAETRTNTDTASKPDFTHHEARKYCKLALAGNPTALELIWLPDDLYRVRGELGGELIAIRDSFLSAQRVRDAYLGYATQQFNRLDRRGDGSFSADTRKRTAKHARHLLRLCYQGLRLYAGGGLTIRLDENEVRQIREFGEAVAGGDVARARAAIFEYEYAFNNTKSPLPEAPDEAVVERWLQKVRKACP